MTLSNTPSKYKRSLVILILLHQRTSHHVNEDCSVTNTFLLIEVRLHEQHQFWCFPHTFFCNLNCILSIKTSVSFGDLEFWIFSCTKYLIIDTKQKPLYSKSMDFFFIPFTENPISRGDQNRQRKLKSCWLYRRSLHNRRQKLLNRLGIAAKSRTRESCKVSWRRADFAFREWWHRAEVVIHNEITRCRRRVRLACRPALNISKLE